MAAPVACQGRFKMGLQQQLDRSLNEPLPIETEMIY